MFVDELLELPDGFLNQHKCVLCRRISAFVGYDADGQLLSY